MDQGKGTKKGAVVVAAAVGLQLLSGILYIWSVIKDQLIAEYQWSDAGATLPYTLATLVFSVSMFFAGRLQDKNGPRLMASLGAGLLGIGLILAAFANTVGLMVLSFSLLIGAGIGINNAVTTPAAVKWYPADKKGRITGLVVAGVAVASILYSPLVKFLTERFGLKSGLILLGGSVLLLALGLAQLIQNPPPGYQAEASGKLEKGDPGLSARVEMGWKQMLGTGNFYKLFAMFAFSASAGLMVIGHLTRIAREQAGWEGGFLLVMLIALFNALGRFAGGALSDRIGRKALMRLAFLVQAANMALFGSLDSVLSLALGVAVAGLCYGACFSVFPATIADLYGIRNFGANYGLLFLAWGVGGLLGPQIAGGLFDASGSYQTAYWLAFALLLAATAISFTLQVGEGRSQVTGGCK